MVILRTTLAVRTRVLGPDDLGTLVTAGHLVNVLQRLGEYAEAEAIDRGMLEKGLRSLGSDHRDTLATAANLATSLS